MSWSKIKLILGREVRDQLRDRRTLFMIAVLPMLLYPLLGMSFFQITQFMREHPTQVLVLGASGLEKMKDLPPLLDDRRFADDLFDRDRVNLLEVTRQEYGTEDEAVAAPPVRLAQARAALQRGDYQAVVYFPPDFAERLKEFRAALLERGEPTDKAVAGPVTVPSPKIYINSASEKSQIAYNRVSAVLERWTSAIGQQNLRDSKVPAVAAWPFETKRDDVAAEGSHQDAAVWSKVLPFVLLIWALTGAFYPAIDLCAGEKERGTLETLLSSPLERSEIVWGKLLTIMLFSMATAALNLLSMGATGAYLIAQLKAMPLAGGGIAIGLPPLTAFGWLLLALAPMAALFSALCLALAAFARSTKEGQYYLMPLVLVMMPLMILPMAPGVELSLGNSLIPVTGVMLLLRTVLEGNYLHALPFVFPVVAVTLGCCLLSIRWAIDQFNRESVLFRESERLDLGLWVRHLVRDRGPTPTIAEAIACFVLIMIIQFFMNLAMSGSERFVQVVFISQVVVIALPALLMTLMLTRRPRQTLLLDKMPSILSVAVALVLAVAMHPIAHSMQFVVQSLYPVSPEIIKLSQTLSEQLKALPLWAPLLLIGVLPALCEEVAFRGFILSGLRHTGHKWMAIALSAVFFGMAHSILQQSLMAALLGMLLGYIAIQSGSLVPCMVFHATHNSLMVLASQAKISPEWLARYPQINWLVQVTVEGNETSHVYAWPLIIAGAMITGYLLSYLHRLPYQKTAEETLQEALQHQSAHSLASEERAMAHLALSARYVFPIDAPPLEDGVVTIDGERIVAVGRKTAGPPPIDLGNVALLPGLVNAHTHLEFSDLDVPIGEPGLPLPTWLAAVVAHRRARDPNLPSSVTRGLRELVACGVTLCGEIARPEWLAAEIEAAPLDALVFVELIGLAANRIEPLATLAAAQLRRAPGGNWRPAISPHAPYSVHPAVVERVSRGASQSAVAMHLAESREELDWLRTGAGPFAEFLGTLGVDARDVPRGRPLDYLRRLSHARRSLVIHGNYLDREELDFLAAQSARMSLVYCPRTHAFFGHEPYPLATALAMGIDVALGTDSRASNPDLNLLSELRFIARHHPGVPLPRVLELGTIAGARALDYATDVGTLTRGKLANLAAVSLPDAEGDPYELLLANDGACCGSWFRGVARH